MSRLFVKRLLYYQFVQNPSLKFFTTTTSTANTISTTQSLSFTVEFLVNSCGLPLETALSTSQKTQLDKTNPQKHDSVLAFLKSHGFSKTHITKFIIKHPPLLHCKLNGNLKPKIEFLLNVGFSGSRLPEILISNPMILSRSLDNQLKPAYNFLMTILQANEKVILALKRASWLLTFDLRRTVQPNVAFLVRQEVPISNIAKLIVIQPRSIMQKADRFVNIVETIKKMGLEPSVLMFIHAVRVMAAMTELTWNRKMEMFKSFGWSKEQIVSAFKRVPLCMVCSEQKINRMTDFFVNNMKVEQALIISCPKLLMYGLETRIQPRIRVLQFLESKKLLKEDKKLVWLLTLTEQDFLKQCIAKYLDRVPDLVNVYRGTISANKTY